MKNEYKTVDIGCAAYLVTIGNKISRIEPKDGSRKSFVFNGDAEKQSERYWSDEATVNPREFASALKELKARIFNE